MGILKSDQPVGRHAAAKRHEAPSWLPDKKFGKTIVGLSALAVTMTCFTVRTSVDLATHGEKDPTPVTDRTDNLPQPAVPGDSIDTSTDTDQSSSDRVVVDGAFYESTCQIWRESGQAGKFVCANPNRTFNPGFQPVGGANPNTQFHVNIDRADQSTTA
mgnify:CR=1 FL=1